MKKGIIKSTIYVSLFTIIIKILGLLKQALMANIAGASIETDAFYISTGVIGQLASFIFSALSITLLTFYSKKTEESGKEEANKLINSVLKFFIPISILIFIIIYLLSGTIAKFLAPTYSITELTILMKYIKIVAISFIPWCYYLVLNVILENEKRFIPGRFQGFFQNLFLSLALIMLFQELGAIVLVFAFILSGICECFLVTFCTRKKFKLDLKNTGNFTEIKKLLVVSLPLMIGNAVSEINDIVDKKISTSIGVGNASLLTYGATLNEIVTGVIISSFSIVLFSHLSTAVAKKNMQQVERNIEKSISYLIFLLLPVTIFFLVSGKNIINIIYGMGKLSPLELEKIYLILIGYSIGFIFQAIRIIFAKALYAFQNTKAPMINGFISIVINIILSILLSSKFGVIGISLSTSISMLVASFLLFFDLKKYIVTLSFKKNTKEYAKLIISSIITFLIVFMCHNTINTNILFELLIELLSLIIIYIGILIVMKSKFLKEITNIIYSILKRHIWRKNEKKAIKS